MSFIANNCSPRTFCLHSCSDSRGFRTAKAGEETTGSSSLRRCPGLPFLSSPLYHYKLRTSRPTSESSKGGDRRAGQLTPSDKQANSFIQFAGFPTLSKVVSLWTPKKHCWLCTSTLLQSPGDNDPGCVAVEAQLQGRVCV